MECDLNHHILSKSRSCFRRFGQVKKYYHEDNCFADYGLKGNVTDCQIIKYLIQVEETCLDVLRNPECQKCAKFYEVPRDQAKKGDVWGSLYNQLAKCGTICSFLKSRILNNEKIWSRTYDHVFHHDEVEFVDEEGYTHHKGRKKKSVFIHLGLLKQERGLDFGKGALIGGPLGELNQWADLIAALHVLGHELTLSWSPETLEHHITIPNTSVKTCRKAKPADIFYTDIHGVRELYKLAGNNISKIRCTLRILDSFGTEPAFNHEGFVIRNDLKKGYGQFHLNPQQYFTQWPHTPDNSFMGFVVHRMSAEEAEKTSRNPKMALLYGKKEEIIHREEASLLLSIIRDEFDVHATLFSKENEGDISSVPTFIENHGYVNQSAFLQLLRQSKVYVGLGKPPEGPAALEAIANGAIFLQPAYDPPINSYESKPTSRMLTSQNPFMETLGGNYSFTYDQFDEESIRDAIENVHQASINQHVPYPFTHEGVLKRIHAYTEHQNFCDLENDWPPKETMKIKLGEAGQSCNQVCEGHSDHSQSKRADRCQPSWFKHINNLDSMLHVISNCREGKEL